MIFSSGKFEEAIIFMLAALIAIVFHECAHGLVAKWNGDLTAKYAGRITLNPVKHFDLFGFILLMTAGFGYAKPVPVNPYNFRHPKKGIVLTSVAGVTANLILAFFASLFCVLIEKFGFSGSSTGEFGSIMVFVCWYFFYVLTLINVTLVIFNLLPIYPLDGHRLLEAATGPMNKVTKFLRDFGPYLLIIFVLLGVFMGMLERYIPSIPAWLDPLGWFISTVGGGFANVFFSLWRWIMGIG